MRNEIPFGNGGEVLCITRRFVAFTVRKPRWPPLETKTTNSIPEGNLHSTVSKKVHYYIASIEKSSTFAPSLVKSIIGLLNALTH